MTDMRSLLDEPPSRFKRVLDGLCVATDPLPLPETPPLLLRTVVLRSMLIDIELDDIGRFFESWPSEVGAYGNEAIGWCEEMGAVGVAEMLRLAIAFLPGGVLPREFQLRFRAVSDARDLNSRDPFPALGRKYRADTAALQRTLYTFLMARRAELLEELTVVERRVLERDTKGLVRIKDKMKFLDAVDDAVERRHPGVSKADAREGMSPARRVSLWMRGAYVYAGNDGMWKFLAGGGGAHTAWDDAQRWCRAIGADRMAAYLAATAAAFPGGRIPADYDEMMAAIEGFERDQPKNPKNAWHGVDALRRVDMEHDGALDDMATALRAFVKAHGVNWIDALERVERGEVVSPAPRPTARRMTGRETSPKQTKVKRQRPTPAAPEALGHPALDALFAAAHTMSLDDWARAVRKWPKTHARYSLAHERVTRASPDGPIPGIQSGARGEARARQELHGRAYTLTHHFLKRIPKVYVYAGEKLPLELRSAQLLYAAQLAIMTHQAGEPGVDAEIAILLKPFGPSPMAALKHVKRSPARKSSRPTKGR